MRPLTIPISSSGNSASSVSSSDVVRPVTAAIDGSVPAMPAASVASVAVIPNASAICTADTAASCPPPAAIALISPALCPVARTSRRCHNAARPWDSSAATLASETSVVPARANGACAAVLVSQSPDSTSVRSWANHPVACWAGCRVHSATRSTTSSTQRLRPAVSRTRSPGHPASTPGNVSRMSRCSASRLPAGRSRTTVGVSRVVIQRAFHR